VYESERLSNGHRGLLKAEMHSMSVFFVATVFPQQSKLIGQMVDPVVPQRVLLGVRHCPRPHL